MSRVYFFKWIVSLLCLLVCHWNRGQETQPWNLNRTRLMAKLAFISVGQNVILAHLQKQEETSLCPRGTALCACDTEGQRDPRADVVGKNGVEVFGVFYVQFCLSASWVRGKRRVRGGMGSTEVNGLYVSAYRKRLLGFGGPCSGRDSQ